MVDDWPPVYYINLFVRFGTVPANLLLPSQDFNWI